MRLLHTADWHVGKRLYGADRDDETRAVLAEVRDVAEREGADAVLVAGDLLDRRLVDPAALGACLGALRALAEVAPVVAITGNHDDPDLWEHLAPYLEARRIHVAGRVRSAVEEAVRTIDTAAGPLHVAMLPWLEPGRLELPAGADVRAARGTYADAVGAVVEVLAAELRRRREGAGGAAALLGHLLVDGAAAGGGERELTLGIAYAIAPAAVPTDLDYLALGHVHRPQGVPRSPAPGGYAGSPLALDFSEDAHAKSVTAAEIDPAAQTTTTRRVPLTAGRPLARIRGPLEALPELAAAHPGAWLLCEVELDAVHPDLVREVRERVPDALRIEPRYAADAGEDERRGEPGERRSLPELYREWYAARGLPLDPRQAEIFEGALDRAGGGT